MNLQKCTSFKDAPSHTIAPSSLSNKGIAKIQFEEREMGSDRAVGEDVDIDHREIYFLIMRFLSNGPCRRTFEQFCGELLEHHLLPRRYHAWYSRSGVLSGQDNDDGISFPSSYSNLVERYPHIDEDHLVKLLKQLMLNTASSLGNLRGRDAPTAANGPTLLGTGSFSLLGLDRKEVNEQVKAPPAYLRWPHMLADQVRGLSLREIGGGFRKHHRAPSLHLACYTIAKPSTMFQKMENTKKIRGHRSAVYCAIFDRAGRYVITGSDDRLVKIWSMETALCLASCRGHEGDITDLAVSSNNALVASASNDFSIRVWRLPDGYPISVLRGHVGAVTAIAFSPRHSSVYQLLSSSDDGTCRIWDARSSDCRPRVYVPKPIDGKISGPSSSNGPPSHQILCCSYNANGTVFVTGSSDTFARVWSACKSNTNDLEQPNHEIDVLAGHENDVNYVQFSGCAVTPRSSALDSFPEDHKQRFRNSWFNHDNIVTCSRDGSAIIWAQKSRKSHGKAVRWSRSYHLKVPPPPMLLQPPRGGPRQRFLPTPRGVNMIVWSLDNRFVLAAIMDCRICVWNASDGSLVHSLTGHTQSTYVLDVHPFNPRIAMSAGYDGITIIWDIWEGLPIKIYNIGHHKLVDGKFSQDGTSIVLSDDVGQIYLLNTGQGESQKDAKYDQFFLGDYRPLILDTLGNVVDQETQLPPYRRNIQDALCDGSMMPYPEPYQSVYQRRRLGALGIEWRPSSIKFAIGTDIGLGPELLPLADLDAVIEPLPEFIDAMYWDLDNEVVNDDNDSEYDIAEELSSEGERKRSLPSRSPSDSACSSEDDMVEQDGLRRSKRKKDKLEVKLMTSSGRRLKRSNLDESGGTSSRTKRAKKRMNGRKTSKRKSIKEKSLRPQRAAARNALTFLSQIEGSSSDEDCESLEDDSSESETMSQNSDLESKELNLNLSDEEMEDPKAESTSLHMAEKIGHPRRLVLKFSIRDTKKSETLENIRPLIEHQADLASRSSSPSQETSKGTGTKYMISCSAIASENSRTESSDKIPISIEGHLETSVECKETKTRLGTMHIKSEDLTAKDASNDFRTLNKGEVYSSSQNQSGEGIFLSEEYRHEKQMETSTSKTIDCLQNIDVDADDALTSSFSDECRHDLLAVRNHTDVAKENSPLKPTKLRIISKKTVNDLECPSQFKFRTPVDIPANDGDDVMSTGPPCVEDGGISSSLQRSPSNSNQKMADGNRIKIKFKTSKGNFEGFRPDQGESTSKVNVPNRDLEFDSPEIASGGKRRTRSMKLNPTSREREAEKKSFRLRPDLKPEDTSDVWMSSSKRTTRSRSTRNRGGLYPTDDVPNTPPDWLLLPRQEDCYRYIPQLGDEVIYLRQGHQEYLQSINRLDSGPWFTVKGHISAVEFCSVESLKYSTLPGSGESCCKLILKFIDPSSAVLGGVFRLTLSELNDFPDFLVERTRYEAAILRNWTARDKCLVWWREDRGQSGNWWEGRILSSKDKSNEFPGSPWERYLVQYKSDPTNMHLHSPWELHDLEISWEHPHIDDEIKDELLSSFGYLTHSVRNQERYGTLRLNQIALKLDFQNRFAVPLSPALIELRLKNSYYRSLVAVKHDINVMLSNALSYFEKNAEFTDKMRRLSELFSKTFSNLEAYE